MSASLVGKVQRLVAGTLAGDGGSMTFTGRQILLEADAGEGKTLRVSFQQDETSSVWPITDHGSLTELTDLQHSLTAGPR
ncbi:hypothetical protein [Deinococcus malanensis]|nr:hypothetical protein [Deinococcus malanensis]